MASAQSADSDNPKGPGDRHGADATARLLVALTSLYAQRPVHAAEERRQYVELVLSLMDKAGPAARAAVAARLRRHPDAPAEVIAQLGEMPCPDDGSPDGNPPHAVADHLVDGPLGQEGDRCPAAGECKPAPEPMPDLSGDAAPAARQPAPETPAIGAAFFAASPPERCRLLSLLAARTSAAAPPESRRRFHLRIDATAWRDEPDTFVHDFARMIEAPKSLCDRILNDPSGEPMVIAARAAGMPVGLLQRILLLFSPAVCYSVQRVHELTDLYHGLDGQTARDVLAVWREKADGEPPQTALAVTNRRTTSLRSRFDALNARLRRTSQGVG